MTNEPEPNTHHLPQPSELVEQLRRFADLEDLRVGYHMTRFILLEAADRLTQLEAQLAKLQAVGDKLAVALAEYADTSNPVVAEALTEWKDRA